MGVVLTFCTFFFTFGEFICYRFFSSFPKDSISLTGPVQSRRYGDTTSLASVNSQVRLMNAEDGLRNADETNTTRK